MKIDENWHRLIKIDTSLNNSGEFSSKIGGKCFLLRCFNNFDLLFVKNGELERCPVTGRTFDSLMSHEEELRMDPSKMGDIQFHYNILTRDIPNLHSGMELLDLKLFTQILGKLQCNAFSIVDASFVNVGEGMHNQLIGWKIKEK